MSAGIRYMLAGAFWFSVMSVLVKLAGQRIPSQEIVLVRGVVTLALSVWLVRRARLSPWGNNRRLLLVRGLLGFAALSCFYYSLTHLPIAEATVIQYLNPVFTAVLAAVLLGERIGWLGAAGVLAGLAGVALVARPAVVFGGLAVPLDAVAVGVALGGAALSAGAYVAVRRLSATEHPLVIVFYFPLVTVPATIPTLLTGGAVWPTALEWAMLIGVGVSTQIGQVYLTRGLALEAAGRAMTVGYSQILFAAAWGFLLFGETPDVWLGAGAMLVIGGTLAVALRREIPVSAAAHAERPASASSPQDAAARRDRAGNGRPNGDH